MSQLFWVLATAAGIASVVLVVVVTTPKWSTTDDEYFNEDE